MNLHPSASYRLALSASRESMSPTMSVGTIPAACRWRAPRSAQITAAGFTAATCSRRNAGSPSSPPVTTKTIFFIMSILHGPDLPAGDTGASKKGPYPFDGIWPLMIFPEAMRFAIPYAGITQIRFKGYLLSQNRRPLLYVCLYPERPAKIKPDSAHPHRGHPAPASRSPARVSDDFCERTNPFSGILSGIGMSD